MVDIRPALYQKWAAMQRRDFLGVCAATCALGTRDALPAEDLKPRLYARVQLTDERGRPLNAASLVAGRNYIFHYPFESTPCFLLNLGKPTVRDVQLKTENGSAYQWAGGVGPNRSVVGYSAICAHRMSYPTPQISFISYREKSTAGAAGRPNTIHCCSEHSQYDPAAGAKVLSGPAPQPLAAILLEHDAAPTRCTRSARWEGSCSTRSSRNTSSSSRSTMAATARDSASPIARSSGSCSSSASSRSAADLMKRGWWMVDGG